MKIHDLAKNWQRLGERDPMWAVLTWPDKAKRGWKADEFYATGVQEIDEIMAEAASLGHSPGGTALDFGCGVGRLTFALSRYYDRCVGVDIASSMLEEARRQNPDPGKCCFYLNTAADLALFEDQNFDFIYTNFVLQHMRPDYALKYIDEFLRVLKNDGLLVFQAPRQLRRALTFRRWRFSTRRLRDIQRSLARSGGKVLGMPVMEVYAIPPNTVRRHVTQHSGRILKIKEKPHAEPGWHYVYYWVAKSPQVP